MENCTAKNVGRFCEASAVRDECLFPPAVHIHTVLYCVVLVFRRIPKEMPVDDTGKG